MDDAVAIWREALKEAQHPRHQAAWLLFTPTMQPTSATRLLAAQKEAVIPWLFEILDSEVLYELGSLGDGVAPIHAVELLGAWQVREAVSRLLKLLEDEDWEAIVHDRAITVLQTMGAVIIDDLIAFGDRSNNDLQTAIASILSHVGQGDERAYQWVLACFQRQANPVDVEFVAESLLAVDAEHAIPVLAAWLQKRKANARTREVIQRWVEEARQGKR